MTKFAWPIKLTMLGLVTAIVFASSLGGGAYNHYYAAIEYSMSQSFSNLFFGAIEPLGAIALDKIPGSFWLPAIAVRFFGFSVWAINLPNVLAFAAGTVLLAQTVKRLTNQTWGLVAGLIAASTPVLAAVAQSNQPAPAFFLSLTLVIFLSTKVLADGNGSEHSLRNLIFVGLAIALAFQSYMLEAWAIWPALIVGYLSLAMPWIVKIRNLVIAGSVSLVASLAWIIAVAFVPSTNRPYIGSTLKNSPWEMVFGYNGLGRFSGSHDAQAYKSIAPAFAGPASLFRLFNRWVAGEISWLIASTVIAIALLILFKKLNAFALMLSVWFATLAVMYSAVAGMHQFYTAIMALPMAGLISIALFHSFESKKYWQASLIATAGALTAVAFTVRYNNYFRLVTLIQVVALVALVAVVFLKVRGKVFIDQKFGKQTAATLIVVALLATPAAWALDTRNHPSSFNPVAGPKSIRVGAPAKHVSSPANPGVDIQVPDQSNSADSPAVVRSVLTYGRAHRGGSKYLFAMFTAVDASPWILDSRQPILPIGGFNGSDNVPTLGQFKSMVKSNTVRLVVDNTSRDAKARKAIAEYLRPDAASTKILEWVIANCKRFDDRGQIWSARRDIYDCSAKP
jgi:4-amino-4-deoxy-L-arabinose transferase-like glycosyltransferase